MGQRYEVDGRQLMLRRSGTGEPSVVFIPGAGLVGLDFLNVQERTAALTTSVLYDRAGTGWSDDVPLPRSAQAVAAELRDLLEAAGIPKPYVLVGHSIGGLYARRYVQLFPDEVAGLVLLDPGHEDMFEYLPPEAAELNERMKADLPELTQEQLDASRTALQQLYAGWPDDVRGPLVDYHLENWRTGVTESSNLETELYGELRHGGGLPDVPLLVLTATGRNPYWEAFADEDLMRKAQDGIRAMHAALAASVPRGEQRLLDGASHQYLHIQQPDAVVDAIRDQLR